MWDNDCGPFIEAVLTAEFWGGTRYKSEKFRSSTGLFKYSVPKLARRN